MYNHYQECIRLHIVVLLTDLFGLHSSGVLFAEAEFCDGHVIQDDVKVFSSLD